MTLYRPSGESQAEYENRMATEALNEALHEENARLRDLNAELLAALKNMRLAHRADIESYEDPDDWAHEVWDQAERAIARAEEDR